MLTFLDFPREIRDQIYELVLVHGTNIPISSTKKFLLNSYGQLYHVEMKEPVSLCGKSFYWEPCYCEDCTKNTSSRVQPIIRRDIKRSFRNAYTEGNIRNAAGTLLRLQQSYGQPEVDRSGFAVDFRQLLTIFDRRNLSIFLANRKIYREASPIFYSRNKFDFGCRTHDYFYSDSLMNVSGFIQDRSKHALSHLKSIRFALGKHCKDQLERGVQYDDCELKTLCEKLAKYCQLTELDVGILGTYHSASHPCLKQLCKIKDLRNLHIWIYGRDENYDALKSSLATIKTFRSQSLIHGDKMGEDDIDFFQDLWMIRVSTWKPAEEDDVHF